MSLIEYAPVSTYRSPTVISGVLPAKLPLSGAVTRVAGGTPLRPGRDGWEIAKDGLGEFVVAAGGWGGETVDGYRAAVLDFHRPKTAAFVSGARYRVADVDDKGVPEFVQDDAGAFVATDHTCMLMDMGIAGLYGRATSKLAQSQAGA